MCAGRTKSALLGSRPVRWRRESRLALGLALAAALVLGVSLPGAIGASGQPGDLRREQTALSARSESALLGLYALESRLAQARSELARLRARSEALRAEEERVRREAAIVEGNLRAAQSLLGEHLRSLYQEEKPDGIAVVLGATSLDDAVTRLDELDRAARFSAAAVRTTQSGRAALRRLLVKLAAQVRAVRALEARAAETALTLSRARAERVAYIASLARQRRLNARQIARLDAQAQRVVERAEVVQAQSAATLAVASGTHTLTVTATGYSLPGRTATGLPVGWGIVAVDPAVIPLGTRMTIPGYGSGVAADTGSAVQGYTIDLWFPTVADALAWGRRTVTITLH
jgi:3D (Asp-Asp-Asp) domain-containing protein